MRYRKKPVVIDAFEWKADVAVDDVPQWFVDAYNKREVFRDIDGSCAIRTLEGSMVAQKGDMIICGVKGEIYPCKPDIFNATYEPA